MGVGILELPYPMGAVMIGPDHADSAAVSRVWALVCGLRTASVRKRLLLTVQAFVDESYSTEGGIYVLAGALASSEAWAAFVREWEELLVFAPVARSGKRVFKMQQMKSSPYLPAFYKATRRHAACTFAFAFAVKDLNNAKTLINNIPGLQVNWGMDFIVILYLRLPHSYTPLAAKKDRSMRGLASQRK